MSGCLNKMKEGERDKGGREGERKERKNNKGRKKKRKNSVIDGLL